MYKEISYGNFYNIPVPVYYKENDDNATLAELPTDTVPAIVIVNKQNDFHCRMLDSNGNWNKM